MFECGIVMPLYPPGFLNYFQQSSICMTTYLFMPGWAVLGLFACMYEFVGIFVGSTVFLVAGRQCSTFVLFYAAS